MIVVLNIFVKKILPKGIVRTLRAEEKEYYEAPFKKMKDRKVVWRWPNELPINGKPTDVCAMVNSYSYHLQKSEFPKLLFFAHPGGIITAPMVEWCKNNLKNLITVDVGKGIHYLQEDNPHQIGLELATWYSSL